MKISKLICKRTHSSKEKENWLKQFKITLLIVIIAAMFLTLVQFGKTSSFSVHLPTITNIDLANRSLLIRQLKSSVLVKSMPLNASEAWPVTIDTKASNINKTQLYLQIKKQVLTESVFINEPEVPSVAAENVKNKTLNILWINKPIWVNLGHLNAYLTSNCSYSNCRMTISTKNMRQMDAIVFSTQESLRELPQLSLANRPKDQVWVFFRMEPPAIFYMSWYRNPIWRNTMNWSWGYRLDSDIFLPYGELNARYNSLNRNYSAIYRRKTRDAAWVVSRCHRQNKRDEYVKELQNLGISVDIFGLCSENKQKISWDQVKSTINEKYKFYISFENSFCKDYITEKFFKYFELDTVLLVRGALNYSKYFDKSTFINTADFASVQEVVAYLKRVGNNETLYTRFLREKDKYIPTSMPIAQSSCVLCKNLNNRDQNERVYDDIESFIHSNTCYTAKDIL